MKQLILSSFLFSVSLLSWSQEEGNQRTSGYYGRGSLGLLLGELSNGSAQVSNGYSFSNGLQAGIGIGYENYYYTRYTPLFAEARYHFGHRKSQPFIGIMGGYLAGLNQFYTNNGFTTGLQAGVTHFFTDHFGISSSIGYRYVLTNSDQFYYEHGYFFAPSPVPTEFHRLEVRFGIVFR